MVMSVQADGESQIDQPMDDMLVHIVVCSWSAYDTVMPHPDSHRSHRSSEKLLGYDQRFRGDGSYGAKAIVPVPRSKPNYD